MENLINVLNSLGFTESEAKVYISLLQSGVQNGYEISKASGVPRSKVYVVLERLVTKGILKSSHNGKNVVYKAEPVSQVEKLARLELNQSLDLLQKETSKLSEIGDDDQIWRISGYDSILLHIESMIKSAQKEILIQIWEPELQSGIESLLEEKGKDVQSAIILYDNEGKYENHLDNVYIHGFEKPLLEENHARWCTCVIDNAEVIYATIPNKKQATAIHTKNTSMVWFATQYVKHDAYCLKMLRDLPEATRAQYGSNLMGLRNIFNL